EWNPQLFRELKGRLKPVNVLLAVISSLLLQLVVFLYQFREYPREKHSLTGDYCKLSFSYQQQQNQLTEQQYQLQQKLSNYQQIKLSDPSIIPNLEAKLKTVESKIIALQTYISKNFCPPSEINYQLWWQEHWKYIFVALSVTFIFTLLVAGTYLIISDLAKEEQKGTLNFIRLSPQSETSILTGKMLGVPSLIYLFVLTAIPLHFWAGKSANISASYIICYYTVVVGSCGFFYSAALLFGLVSRLFSSFQPWLGSGGVLLYQFFTMMISSHNQSDYDFNNPYIWFRLFSPWDITNYLFSNFFNTSNESYLHVIQFFYLPIGNNILSLVGLYLINYGICSYGIWTVIKRCFRNNQSTILSKQQSYWFIAFTQIVLWGFTLQTKGIDKDDTYLFFAIINTFLIIGLMFLLSPIRQNIQDWARYRHQNQNHQSFWQDLMIGEKSPAILAMGVNILIATTPIFIGTIFFPLNNEEQGKVFLTVVLSVSVMLVYATITQLLLLMKNSKRYLWVVGVMGAGVFLPYVILYAFSLEPHTTPNPWLFTAFPWVAVEHSTITATFTALLFNLTVVTLLNRIIYKKVEVLGESATKALLAGR
ncbi:MAG: ABC transporter permease, partial [Nostocales cyanobacterium]